MSYRSVLNILTSDGLSLLHADNKAYEMAEMRRIHRNHEIAHYGSPVGKVLLALSTGGMSLFYKRPERIENSQKDTTDNTN